MSDTFTAVLIEEVDGKPRGALTTLSPASLPDHEVLIEVACSTLNYKDGLAVSGAGRIARRLPMVAGIDLAGTVLESRVPEWRPGDRVLVNGCGLSETEWGGYCQRARMRAEWLVRVPDVFTFYESMAIGTAGYTAMLAVLALERWGLQPDGGEVLVTGAAGGVGSVAIAVLAELGYAVVAASGRPETESYLRSLGATDVIDRTGLAVLGKPLQKERWAAVIDSVGGAFLANAIAQTRAGGAVAACGNAGSADLPGSVFPFILRGVALLGINSVTAPRAQRELAWQRLAYNLRKDRLELITSGVEPMSRLPELAQEIIAGRVRGRLVIDVNR